MYISIVKRQIRHSFERLSAGDYEAVLRRFAPNVHFSFAGDHPLSGEYEGVQATRDWFQRFFQFFPGLHFEIHDVVVNGWPWNTVIATRFSVQATLSNGRLYRNAGMQYVRLRWGRIVEDRIYEDTQTLALVLQQITDHRRGTAIDTLPNSI